jgi:hypothetical protein
VRTKNTLDDFTIIGKCEELVKKVKFFTSYSYLYTFLIEEGRRQKVSYHALGKLQMGI